MEGGWVKVKFILVDDHILFRAGLRALLETNKNYLVLGEAGDGEELMEIIKVQPELPDVILMDIQMPKCDGLQATRMIKEKHPQIKIVMLSICEDEEALAEAVKLGAEGYLLKNLSKEKLFDYIEELLKGESPVSPIMVTKIIQRVVDEDSQLLHVNKDSLVGADLTNREKEVLEFLVRGHTNNEIAIKLDITINTVKHHLKNLMKKLHVVNRTQLSTVVVQNGLHKNSGTNQLKNYPNG